MRRVSWLLLALMLCITACTAAKPVTTPAFRVVEMLLRDGDTTSSLDLSDNMQIAIRGDAELKVRFSERVDLEKAVVIFREAKLLDEYTLSLPLRPGMPFVIGSTLKSIRGDSLGVAYRIMPVEEVRVLEVQVVCFNDGSSRRKGVTLKFDPSLVRVFPLVGDAEVSFSLNRQLTQEEIEMLPSGVRPIRSGFSMDIPLGTSQISLPEWLRDSNGYPVELNASHEPWPRDLISVYPEGHEELEYSYGGSVPLAPGETVVFNFHWPFVRSFLEAAFQQGLADINHTLEWEGEDKVLLTVLERKAFSVNLEWLIDTYGCRVNSGFVSGIYDFSMTGYDTLKKLNLTTGEEFKYTVSPSISGATTVSSDNLLTAYRYYFMGSSEDGFRGGHDLVYNLETGTVQSYGPLRPSWVLSEVSLRVKEAIEPHITSSQGAWDFTTSPSGTKVSAIVYTVGEPGSYIYILDLSTGMLKKHFIGPYIQELQRRHPILWSYDEKYLFYGRWVIEWGIIDTKLYS